MAQLQIPRQTIDKYSKIVGLDEYIKAICDQIDLDSIEISLNRVLCAAYITSERTAGGIILTTDTKAEDIWQGKAALVLKVGSTAFLDTPDYSWHGFHPKPFNWVTFKVGNASQIEISQYPLRIVADHYVESIIADPRMVTS